MENRITKIKSMCRFNKRSDGPERELMPAKQDGRNYPECMQHRKGA